MANFTPLSAAIGGILIGVAAVMLMAFNGRIAGISGIFSATLTGGTDRAQSAAFIVGLLLAPLVASLAGYRIPVPDMPGSWLTIGIAGLLVGFGTRLGGGCTSGHGICGIARLSRRSIAATAIFMGTAIAVVALHRLGS